ncbi:MAG: ABC transporter ATP-binding protein [Thermoguttaceae bacterium]
MIQHSFFVEPPLLSVCHLTLNAQKKRLLDDVTFEVKRGEYLAVIGPNGAGKSTLLKCLDCLNIDWSGDVRLDDVSIRSFSQKNLARRIAYLPQTQPACFAFTVRQMVEMGRYPHLKPLEPISAEDQQIVHESLEMMHILELSNRKIDTLSGGERQKVQLATALAQQAEMLFLDEPTTYLDYKHQSEIASILRRLNQEKGHTIIEVTHDVNRALLDSTHVIALGDGKIVFDGNPEYLLETEHLKKIFQIDFQLATHPTLPLKIVIPGV